MGIGGPALREQQASNPLQQCRIVVSGVTGAARQVLGMTPLVLISHLNRQLGLPDQLFALGDDVILTVLGQVTAPLHCMRGSA